ncbi:MAG: hypothetical protein ACM3PR_05370 [Bacteroidales bacterium]
MKSRMLIIGIFLFTCIISCEKADSYIVTDQYEPKYCISDIKDGHNTILLSEDEIDLAKSLFESNHIDDSQLQFWRLQSDALGYHHVRCNQYVNKLKVFTTDVIYHFNQKGIHYFTSGELAPPIELDTLPRMTADAVVEKYLDKLNTDEFYGQSGLSKEIKQGCFEIEFGYCNLNVFRNLSTDSYAKAWKINPKGKGYPYAYINDMTFEVIYYDNGIRY